MFLSNEPVVLQSPAELFWGAFRCLKEGSPVSYAIGWCLQHGHVARINAVGRFCITCLAQSVATARVRPSGSKLIEFGACAAENYGTSQSSHLTFPPTSLPVKSKASRNPYEIRLSELGVRMAGEGGVKGAHMGHE